ncbi:MAG: VOC family protein [Sphingomonadales bacterium]
MPVKIRPLFQHAYFVKDLELAASNWSKQFGAGPFRLVPHHKATEKFHYRGSPVEADVSYAFGYLGHTMIQFIVQHDDRPSIYMDMFKKGEEGFHHLAYLTSDFWGEDKRFTDMGIECACYVGTSNIHSAYYDTRATLGCFTEIHEDPPHMVERFESWRRAHEQFGGDKVFMALD